jgi:3-oxoacyl-[acyl-carrier-protein] synthase-3
LSNELGAMIIATGRAVPDRRLTNFDLEKMVDTSDKWIRERSGIRERRIVDDGVVTSDIATEAGKIALERANVSPEQVDTIIVATITGDMPFPSTACFVQQKLNATNAAAFDISAACSGFIYGYTIANSLIQAGTAKNVLLIGTEVLTRLTDYTDRNTCVLFGDGAGAAVLQQSDGKQGLVDSYWASDGNLSHLLYLPGGLSKHPTTHQTVDKHLHYLKMAGREVFKYAVNAMSHSAVHLLEKTGLTGDDIDLLIPHQANIRIIKATAEKAGIPMEKVVVNLDQYGNTSAASIPLALDEAIEAGRIQPGHKVLLVAFGGGFTWGSAIIQF